MTESKSIAALIDLRSRVAVITGGAGHLGREMAGALAELGASIVLVDQQAERGENAVSEIARRWGGQHLSLEVDLAKETSVRKIAATVEERYGRLDILINCAALVGTSGLKGWAVPFAEQNADTWRLAIEVNLTAPFVLSQTCADLLRRSGHGVIINVGSIYGLVGPDWSLYEGTSLGNPAAYAASKGGLGQLTRWLSTTLAPDIRVNAIIPGGIWRNQSSTFVERYTKKVPLRRMASEEDFKGAIVYLASDLSLYVTGQELVVDGGFTAW
jgi:NAD(P)-dependent dehydrogenase (short-subunit alcohol dehydrogenase family)